MPIVGQPAQPTQPAMQQAAQPMDQSVKQPAEQQAESPTTPKELQRNMVLVAMKLLFTKEFFDQMVTALKSGETPAQTVATLALEVLNRMKKDVAGINPDVVFTIGKFVVLFILDVAKQIGIKVDGTVLRDSLAALAEMKKQEGGQQQQGMDQMQGTPPPQERPQGIVNQMSTMAGA